MQHLAPAKEFKTVQQSARLDRLMGEEIEIDRLAMPQPERDRCAAVENKRLGHFSQIGPQTPLRRGQNVQTRSEVSRHHILNTPNCVSGIGAFRLAEIARPSTSRVWTGSMMPSSHSRAVA